MTAPPVASGPAPAQAAGAGASASAAGAAATGTPSSGLSFNNLLNGSETSAGADSSSTLSSDDGSAASDAGDGSPPSGNILPLLAVLLPPLPLQQPSAVADEAALAAGASGSATTTGPVLLPGVPAGAMNPSAAAGGAVTAPPLPEDALPAALVRADTAQKPNIPPAAKSPVPVHQDLSSIKSALESIAHRQQPSGAAPGGPLDSAIPGSAAAADDSAGNDNDAVLRRWVAALSSAATDAKSSAPPPTGATAANKPIEVPVQLQPAVPADKAGLPAAAPDASGQLLREVKFERISDAPAPAPTVATHVLGAHTATATAATDDTAVLQLQTPMQNSREWSNGLGDRIVWLTSNSVQNAQIRLNPPHLGPIEVQVSVTDNQTTVALLAHHATTRDALEAAAPRLREILGSHGLSNVNVNINHQSSGERAAQSQQQPFQQGYVVRDVDLPATAAGAVPARTNRSSTLLDAYA